MEVLGGTFCMIAFIGYAGSENLSGGSYDVSYYISSYRY